MVVSVAKGKPDIKKPDYVKESGCQTKNNQKCLATWLSLSYENKTLDPWLCVPSFH